MSGQVADGQAPDDQVGSTSLATANPRETPVTLAILGAMLVAFVVQLATGARWGEPPLVWFMMQSHHPHWVWTWVTSLFVHHGVVHLVANGMFLYCWGSGAEPGHGSRVFATVFFATGVGAAVLAAVLKGLLTCGGMSAFVGPACHVGSAGASAALLGCVGYTTARMPSFRISIFPVGRVPLWAFSGVIVAVSLLGIFTPFDPLSTLTGLDVAHVDHLVGLALGLSLGRLWRPDG